MLPILLLLPSLAAAQAIDRWKRTDEAGLTWISKNASLPKIMQVSR